jgi:hypothetical protein
MEMTGGDALDYRLNCTLNLFRDGLASAEHTPNVLTV